MLGEEARSSMNRVATLIFSLLGPKFSSLKCPQS